MYSWLSRLSGPNVVTTLFDPPTSASDVEQTSWTNHSWFQIHLRPLLVLQHDRRTWCGRWWIITSFDICRINLCDLFNAWFTEVSFRFLFTLLRIISFWANVLTSSSRSSFIARMLKLSTIFCSGSMINLKWLLIAIFFDLAGLQGAMFFTDRLDRFFNLPHNLLTLAYIFVLSYVDVLPTLVYQ